MLKPLSSLLIRPKTGSGEGVSTQNHSDTYGRSTGGRKQVFGVDTYKVNNASQANATQGAPINFRTNGIAVRQGCDEMDPANFARTFRFLERSRSTSISLLRRRTCVATSPAWSESSMSSRRCLKREQTPILPERIRLYLSQNAGPPQQTASHPEPIYYSRFLRSLCNVILLHSRGRINGKCAFVGNSPARWQACALVWLRSIVACRKGF